MFFPSCKCFSALHGSAQKHSAGFYMFLQSAKELVKVVHIFGFA